MFCGKCGTEITEEMRFCPKCGSPVNVNFADEKNNQYAELVEKAKQGDEASVSELIKLTEKKLYFVALSYVKKDADAQDVVQNSYIKAFSNLNSLQENMKFEAWMTRIVSNTALSMMQTASARYDVKFTDLGDNDNNLVFDTADENIDAQPEMAYDLKEKSEILKSIIDQLSDEQRVAVMMYFYEQMTTKEIAEELGVGESTVKARIRYAKEKIKVSVTDLQQKQGIKLYNMAPLPFFLFLMKGCSTQGPFGAGLAAPISGALVESARIASHPAQIASASLGAPSSVIRTSSTTYYRSTPSSISNGTTASGATQSVATSTVGQSATTSSATQGMASSTVGSGATTSSVSQGAASSTVTQGATTSGATQGTTSSTISQGTTSGSMSQGAASSTVTQGATTSGATQGTAASTVGQGAASQGVAGNTIGQSATSGSIANSVSASQATTGVAQAPVVSTVTSASAGEVASVAGAGVAGTAATIAAAPVITTAAAGAAAVGGTAAVATASLAAVVGAFLLKAGIILGLITGVAYAVDYYGIIDIPFIGPTEVDKYVGQWRMEESSLSGFTFDLFDSFGASAVFDVREDHTVYIYSVSSGVLDTAHPITDGSWYSKGNTMYVSLDEEFFDEYMNGYDTFMFTYKPDALHFNLDVSVIHLDLKFKRTKDYSYLS